MKKANVEIWSGWYAPTERAGVCLGEVRFEMENLGGKRMDGEANAGVVCATEKDDDSDNDGTEGDYTRGGKAGGRAASKGDNREYLTIQESRVAGRTHSRGSSAQTWKLWLCQLLLSKQAHACSYFASP